MSAPDSSQGPPDLSRLSRVVRENPHFRRLYAANAISQVGDWLSIVALYSLVIDLTGKGESVAIALITHLVPAFVFGPTAGVLADRVSRRTMMITADLLRAALVLCFLFVKGPDDIWFAFGVMTLHSIASAFFEPAQQATFPNLVPEKDLALAGTLENSLWSVSLAVGSMLGGLVIAAVGRNVVFVLDAITFLASAWLIRGLPDRYAYAQKSDASRRAEAELREANQLQSGSAIANLLGLSELREGFRYVLREGRVAAIILVKASFGLTLGGVLVLLAFFGEKVFGDGSGGGYAALYTARGVGSFLGPLVAFRIAGDAPITLRRGVTAAFVVVLTAYVAFSVSPTLWLASIALAFGNAGGSILWTYGSALLQRIVPDEVRGRVAATEMAAMTLAMTGSTWLVGVLVDKGVAPRLLMAACGLVALGPILFWLSVQPRFRAHDTHS